MGPSAMGKSGRMLLIVVCGILLVIGVVLAVVWGGERLIAPVFPPHGSADAAGRRRDAIPIWMDCASTSGGRRCSSSSARRPGFW